MFHWTQQVQKSSLEPIELFLCHRTELWRGKHGEEAAVEGPGIENHGGWPSSVPPSGHQEDIGTLLCRNQQFTNIPWECSPVAESRTNLLTERPKNMLQFWKGWKAICFQMHGHFNSYDICGLKNRSVGFKTLELVGVCEPYKVHDGRPIDHQWVQIDHQCRRGKVYALAPCSDPDQPAPDLQN